MEPVTLRAGLRQGLRARIVLLTLAGALGPSVILGWLSWSSVSSLQQQVLAERQQLAGSVAASVDSQMKSELELLDTVSTSLGNAVANPPANTRVMLREAYLRSHLLSQVFLLGHNGKLVMAEPEPGPSLVPHLGIFEETLKKGVPGISSLVITPGGAHLLFLLVPVTNWRGQVVGLLGGTITPGSKRFRSVLRFVPLLQHETVDLVDQYGKVIASTAAERLYIESDHQHFLEALIKEQRRKVGTCHGCHESGTIHHRVNEVMAFAPLSREIPWGISIHQPEAQAFSTALALRWKMFAWAPVLVALALLFALGAAASITGPLAVLTGRAKGMAAGELKTPIPQLGGDEVGQLGAALEKMRVALQQSLDQVAHARDELELRVQERTSEIEQLYREIKEHDELRAKLLQKLIRAQEEERRRIARELHDETSQVVTVLALGLDAAMAELPPEVSRQPLEEVKALALRTLDGIHRLSFDLRPSVLDDLGLFAAIKWYAERDLKPLGVAVRCEFEEERGRMPPEVETALFRAAQEAITNIAKHARAETVLIQCALEPKAVTIEIEDDGQGFDPASLSEAASGGRGLGLAGIRERVELLGGSGRIESTPGQGTRVVLTVPLAGEHG